MSKDIALNKKATENKTTLDKTNEPRIVKNQYSYMIERGRRKMILIVKEKNTIVCVSDQP